MKTVEELKKEQYEAKANLHELIELINSEEFYTLSPSEKGLINQERTGLELYLSSLTKRIYGNPSEPDVSNVIWLTMLYGMMNSGGGFGNSSSSVDYLKSKLEEKDFEDTTLSDHAV